MGLRFDPIGGGQFKQAVKQIIEAESQPIKQLEAHKAQEEAKLKLFQEFKSKFAGIDKAISEIATFNKLRELKVDFGDGANILGATIDKEKAQPGSYTIRVEEMAAKTSVISNGFADPEDPMLGIGFIIMNPANGDSKELFVDEDHASLRGIADLINQQSDSPVRASVIKDASEADHPWKLIVTGKKDGRDSQIDFPDFYFLDGGRDFYIDRTRDADNAKIEVDGFEIETESNDVVDFLPGVNLHIKQAKPDQPVTMTISEDIQKVAGKVKNLVDQMNGILAFITKQNAVDERSDTRTTFTGDTGLQSVEYRLRNLLHEGFGVGDSNSDDFRRVFLNEIGIEFEKTGQITFKEDKFTKRMEKDFDGTSQAISGQYGFAFQLDGLLKTYMRGPQALLNLREQGLHSRIKDIDQQLENKHRSIDQRQQSLTAQFARLEASLSDMQRQQSALSATLPSGGGNNLVSQLLGG